MLAKVCDLLAAQFITTFIFQFLSFQIIFLMLNNLINKTIDYEIYLSIFKSSNINCSHF